MSKKIYEIRVIKLTIKIHHQVEIIIIKTGRQSWFSITRKRCHSRRKTQISELKIFIIILITKINKFSFKAWRMVSLFNKIRNNFKIDILAVRIKGFKKITEYLFQINLKLTRKTRKNQILRDRLTFLCDYLYK